MCSCQTRQGEGGTFEPLYPYIHSRAARHAVYSCLSSRIALPRAERPEGASSQSHSACSAVLEGSPTATTSTPRRTAAAPAGERRRRISSIRDGAVRAREDGAAAEPPRQVPVRRRGRGARDPGPERGVPERAVGGGARAALPRRAPPPRPLRPLPLGLQRALPPGRHGAQGVADAAPPPRLLRRVGARARRRRQQRARPRRAPPDALRQLPPRQRGAPAVAELRHPRRPAPAHRVGGLGRRDLPGAPAANGARFLIVLRRRGNRRRRLRVLPGSVVVV